MQFEWHETKRQEILAKRGVDILYAALIFDGDILTHIDDRADYGEKRFIPLGLVDGDAYMVVHTPRGEITRLITAWKGGENGLKHYQTGLARRAETEEK